MRKLFLLTIFQAAFVSANGWADEPVTFAKALDQISGNRDLIFKCLTEARLVGKGEIHCARAKLIVRLAHNIAEGTKSGPIDDVSTWIILQAASGDRKPTRFVPLDEDQDLKELTHKVASELSESRPDSEMIACLAGLEYENEQFSSSCDHAFTRIGVAAAATGSPVDPSTFPYVLQQSLEEAYLKPEVEQKP